MLHSHESDHGDELLFESPRGYVRHCRACGAFELRFGNAIVSLTPDDLEILCETVSGYDVAAAVEEPFGGVARNYAVIWVGDTGTGFRFGRDEIAELHRLLAGARLFARLASH